MPKQRIIELQTCRTLRWHGGNDEIINFMKLNYLLTSFFKVSYYIMGGLFELSGLSRFIVMFIAQHKFTVYSQP